MLRHRPDHVFHGVLSLLTAGLWLFVWLGVTLGAREERLSLTVDDFGTWRADSCADGYGASRSAR